MEKLIEALKLDYPGLSFAIGPQLCWSPEKQEIYYDTSSNTTSSLGVLHEIGHARLGHKNYKSDIDLLQKEVSAWQEAMILAKKYDVWLDEAHIQDCLDTYRDWVYGRSICPCCGATGLQDAPTRYRCLNCSNAWLVSVSRLCRNYRKTI